MEAVVIQLQSKHSGLRPMDKGSVQTIVGTCKYLWWARTSWDLGLIGFWPVSKFVTTTVATATEVMSEAVAVGKKRKFSCV